MSELYNIKCESETLPSGNTLWVATCDELPGCITQANTFADCMANFADALKLYLDIPLHPEVPRAETVLNGKTALYSLGASASTGFPQPLTIDSRFKGDD